MSLDLGKTAAQVPGLARHLRERVGAKANTLERALAALGKADPANVERRRSAGKVTWLVAGLDGALARTMPRPPLPPDHIVVAVDGSHIDVDRHSPARCYLINLGHVLLRYGEQPDAWLWNTPSLHAADNELALADPSSVLDVPVEGPLLGMRRAVREVEALADLVDAAPPGMPVVALLDGSLILWGLTGATYPDFVRDALLANGLLLALDRLRAAARTRTLAVASYVSLPRSTDVINALRLHVCPHEPVDCDAHCRALPTAGRPCDAVGGLTDTELFSASLGDGERSALFRSTSSVVANHYAGHAVSFFYVDAGDEVGRVELPAWSADDPAALDLLHAVLLTQVEKGHGYPVALQEAHEQAVVSTGDRELFAQLVDEALVEQGLPIETSAKARSKRTRFV